jgi:hypothetical protein
MRPENILLQGLGDIIFLFFFSNFCFFNTPAGNRALASKRCGAAVGLDEDVLSLFTYRLSRN